MGFKVNSGEYKVMGLAPYGEPKYANLIKNHLIKISEDGSFRLNMKYFDYCTGLKMTNENFHNLFKGPLENLRQQLQKDMDIASSIQSVTNEIVLKICKYIAEKYKCENLCLAGGVALNCVSNSKILRSELFKKIWIQPAAGRCWRISWSCVMHTLFEK